MDFNDDGSTKTAEFKFEVDNLNDLHELKNVKLVDCPVPDPPRQFWGLFDEHGKQTVPPYQYCDLADNFMLIRRECLDDGIRWNPGLKVGEHWDFFQKLKEQGKWKVAFVPSVKIKHENLHDDPPEYQAHRQRASDFNRMMKDPQLPPSIVVLGVGHSGTRIFVRTLEALGWNLGEIDETVAENREVKRIDKQILQRQGICPCGGEYFGSKCCRCGNHENPMPHPAPHEFNLALKSIPQPWCIKDPRMVLTFDQWKPAFSKYRPLLLLVERDLERMRRTYKKYGFPDFRIYGRDVPELVEMARWHFKCWEGPKLKIDYEQLASAASLFDLEKAK
jgi:hypothetical protein